MATRLPYMHLPKAIRVVSIQKNTRRICQWPKNDSKLGELDISEPQYVFGPFFYPESKESAEAKKKAWRKILEKEEKDEEKINEIYLSAIRSVEMEARAAYGDGALNNLKESEFRWMMIKDGCFFLQLTLSILGASKKLDYPDDDPIFVEKPSKKNTQGLIKSMFLLGNQIPLVVLNELMKREFFQKVIEGVHWERPSDMLSKQMLYDFVVNPAVTQSRNHIQTPTSHPKPGETNSPNLQEQPTDLLHGLQLHLLGPDPKSNGSPDETNAEDELQDGDLEAGIKPKSKSEAMGNANEDKKQESTESKDTKSQELCASNLKKKDIHVRHSKSGGTRGIHFSKWVIRGYLYLPTLMVNHDTKVLFTNLKYYEIVHQEKEVRSYLSFLTQLISTYEDLNVLAKQGIIQGSTSSDEKVRFIEMLKTLADQEIMTHRDRSVIGQIKDYSVFPWEYFKIVGILAFILTILETVFGGMQAF